MIIVQCTSQLLDEAAIAIVTINQLLDEAAIAIVTIDQLLDEVAWLCNNVSAVR